MYSLVYIYMYIYRDNRLLYIYTCIYIYICICKDNGIHGPWLIPGFIELLLGRCRRALHDKLDRKCMPICCKPRRKGNGGTSRRVQSTAPARLLLC